MILMTKPNFPNEHSIRRLVDAILLERTEERAVQRFGYTTLETLAPVFDYRMFVLFAGMVEAVIGIVLILGTTVRLAVLALPIMMANSNIVFIVQGNSEAALVEFVGPMPIIGAALLLLLLGYGQRPKSRMPLRPCALAQMLVGIDAV